MNREQLSHLWIRGSGLEIGALHYPLPILPGVKVTYVDLMNVDDLQSKFPEITVKKFDLVIDNGETLQSFEKESQDFIVANHMLEHCENPIGTLKNWLRVLKPGGVILAALPDKHQCFDRKRETTPYWHILKDYVEGPDGSLREHYRDWYVNSELEGKLQGEELERQIEDAVQARQNIHFHVWDFKSLEFMFTQLKERFQMAKVEIHKNGSEIIVICQK
jgi:SAM-dependent methyltransferase